MGRWLSAGRETAAHRNGSVAADQRAGGDEGGPGIDRSSSGIAAVEVSCVRALRRSAPAGMDASRCRAVRFLRAAAIRRRPLGRVPALVLGAERKDDDRKRETAQIRLSHIALSSSEDTAVNLFGKSRLFSWLSACTDSCHDFTTSPVSIGAICSRSCRCGGDARLGGIRSNAVSTAQEQLFSGAGCAARTRSSGRGQ